MNLDMNALQTMLKDGLDEIISLVSTYVPNLLGALVILIVGWLIALAIASLVSGLIKGTKLDEFILKSLGDEKAAKKNGVAEKTKTIVFYLIMLFVLVSFFQALGLTLITQPLNEMLNQIFAFAPRLLGSIIFLLLAIVLATVAKKVLSSVMGAVKIDSKIGNKGLSISSSISETAYWLVLLLMLPVVLNTLGLTAILGPVNDMFGKLLGHLPNILSAGIILVVGWFIAKVVRQIVTNLLSSVGADGFLDSIGLGSVLGKNKLSEILGVVVYVFVLFPVLISALGALKLEAIVAPATNMLDQILNVVPQIFAALVMLAIAVLVGRFAAGLVENLLKSIGFDNLMSWLGIAHDAPKDPKALPSHMVYRLVMATIILFASMEAFSTIGLTSISNLLEQFIVFGGKIIMGLIILAIGLIIANFAEKAISSTASTQAGLLAGVARMAIIVLSSAMGLRQMGLANEIINMAFGILFGAVAVAIALAFGMGCKDLAAKEAEKWLKSMK